MEEKSLYRAHAAQAGGVESILATNKVLKNTYILLSMTLLFSAVTAGISMAINPPPFTGMACSLLALGLLWFGLGRVANSVKGIYMVFAITGLLGFGLGPLLNAYTATANGSSLIMQALGGTGIVFFTLSGYVLTTRKDFSFMGGFLITGLVVALLAIVANIFLQIPALSLALSGVIILIMSGLILYDTSRIINGGETNYVLATISLYLSLYNIFVNLLHLLGALGGDD
jgi:modulator of FtsH protease